jgi:hypothetical protein
MISMFYTKKEMATRMAILYTGNMLASSFSGLIAAAVFQLDGRNGLAGWQWLFVCLRETINLAELRLTYDYRLSKALSRSALESSPSSPSQTALSRPAGSLLRRENWPTVVSSMM